MNKAELIDAIAKDAKLSKADAKTALETITGSATSALKKGDKVGIAGRLVTRSYEDTEGQKKYFTEVVAKDLLLLSKKPTES